MSRNRQEGADYGFANLDAAQSENAAGSLYDAEQAIADNAAAIATLRDSVSQIGTFYGAPFSRMSISSGVITTITEITVPAGVYIVNVFSEFSSGAEYYKRLAISDGEATRAVQTKSDSGTGLSFTGLWKTTSQKTFTFSAMQFSGSTTELVRGMASMIRIK